jgi:GNAT superfamily N-acetyltransferase
MIIVEMTQVTDEMKVAFDRLIPQLTQHSPPPTQEMLMQMAASDAVFVFLAREGDESGRILGSATLGTFITPTGVHGWIEDVVVDQDARRRGIGRALTEACLDKARELSLREVNLTSRAGREAANQLYQQMGFQQRQTNIYRYLLD